MAHRSSEFMLCMQMAKNKSSRKYWTEAEPGLWQLESNKMSYVLGIDVGTTTIRCFAIDHDGNPLASHFTSMEVLHPWQGYSEIDPEKLWLGFREVVSKTLARGNLDPKEAACMGITCQRNSFLLWNRSTGQPICNLITWQDRRAADVCREWNQSMQFKFIHAGAGLMHFFSRSKRFMAASIVNLTCQHVAPRLYWALHHIEEAMQMAEEGNLCFGTVDTWILWKLTDGAVHATDYSNVCTTLLFDPYQLKWSDLIFSIMGIPKSILPELKDTGGLFGHTAEHHFGASIPITGIISDSTSATFAQGCWNPGDLKCTMGTGMFLCINTGSKPHASLTGFYPIVGWKIGEELVYLAEANFPSCGSVVEWGLRFGLYKEPAETARIADSVEDPDGVCFVPAFDGIQAPHNDPHATASIMGITHNTQKGHIVRALLESIVYTFKQLYDVAKEEIDLKIRKIRVDGGVSQNNFVMQLISDLLGREIQRPKDVDMTVYGAIYVAGLAAGFWKSRDEIKPFWKMDRQFNPREMVPSDLRHLQYRYTCWQHAVERCLGWYKENPISKEHEAKNMYMNGDATKCNGTVPDRSENGAVPDRSENGTVPDQSENGTVPDQNGAVPDQSENGTVPDQSENGMVPDQNGAVPDQSENGTVPDQSENGTVPDQSENGTVPDRSENGTVPDQSEDEPKT